MFIFSENAINIKRNFTPIHHQDRKNTMIATSNPHTDRHVQLTHWSSCPAKRKCDAKKNLKDFRPWELNYVHQRRRHHNSSVTEGAKNHHEELKIITTEMTSSRGAKNECNIFLLEFIKVLSSVWDLIHLWEALRSRSRSLKTNSSIIRWSSLISTSPSEGISKSSSSISMVNFPLFPPLMLFNMKIENKGEMSTCDSLNSAQILKSRPKMLFYD